MQLASPSWLAKGDNCFHFVFFRQLYGMGLARAPNPTDPNMLENGLHKLKTNELFQTFSLRIPQPRCGHQLNPNDKSPIEPNSTPLGNIFSVKMQTANWKLKTTKLQLPLQWPIENANATDTLGHVLAVWLVRWSGCRSWPLNGNNQATLSGESEEGPHSSPFLHTPWKNAGTMQSAARTICWISYYTVRKMLG